jgi:membrane protease YdiL (CAAX protease family)
VPDWPAFAGITGVVLAILLVLARVSQAALDEAPLDGADRDVSPGGADRTTPPDSDGRASGADRDAFPGDGPTSGATRPPDARGPSRQFPERVPDEPPVGPVEPPDEDDEGADGDARETAEPSRRAARPDAASGGRELSGAERLSTAALLANVALSQGLLGSLLLVGAWYTAVPPGALGAGPAAVTVGAAAVGAGLGAVLYAANEAGAAVGRRVGLGGGEELRTALAPETVGGWAVLLLVVLPVIAGFEELLFRGALIGAMSAGFGLSPWPLAVGSSVAFAAGHGAQGRVGMAVTGTLGFVLAAAFVVTGSLLTVVVAHYLVNALEFLVHEGVGIDPAEGTWRPGD